MGELTPVANKRTIHKRSKEFKELVNLGPWSVHNAMQEDPLEGAPATGREVRAAWERVGDGPTKDGFECFELRHRGTIVMKLPEGLWFELERRK